MSARRLATPPLVAAALVWGVLVSGDALAGSCCMSTTAGGIGRLKMWEDHAVGVSIPLSIGLGYWDSDATWRAWSDAYSEIEWRPSVYALVRLSDRALVSGVVPAVMTWRAAATVSDLGGGMGDVSAGLRYEVVQIGEYLHVPAVAVALSVTAPTGTSPDRATGPLGADTTARGGALLTAGVSLEYASLPWFAQANLTATFPLPFQRTDLHRAQRFGPGLSTALIGGWEAVRGVLVLSLQLRLAYESETVLAGRIVAESSRVDSGVALGASWTIDPHWTLVANVDSGLFASHLGDNTVGRITPGLSVRYGHF